jgi:beta-glucanase (GH16 family)
MKPVITDCLLKSILPLCFFLILETTIHAQCPKLVWSDEFTGTALDLTKWSYQIGDGCDINVCQWGNNELQWYAQNNVEVSNGALKIVAKRETVQNRNYTSGRIRTISKGDIKYGRIEARMKMPIGQGIWPAFWMMPTDNVYGGWPQSGELDIMEYLGHDPATTHGTIHFGNPPPNNGSSTKSFTLAEGGLNTDFHTYAVEWSDTDIKWFIDGYLFSTKTRADLGGARWPFDQKFHILLNLAVGGNWPGNPNGSTVFPQNFEVDYVRVYDLVGAPYLTGNQKVAFMAKNSAYSLVNVPTGSTIVWAVPAGATIASGNGTKDIFVNWGSIGGKITATVTSTCGETKQELVVKVEPSLTTSFILENFDADRNITRTFNSGDFTDKIATPTPNTVNKSAFCGKYVRNASQQYDVLFYDVSAITNGLDFTSSEKKFYIDINTNAPIGTNILLQLENKSQALPANYPTGRHSRYTAITTKQNEWERLSFAFTDKPDAGVSNQAINQLILLFAPNSNTGSTYYFDNFEIYAKSATATIDIEKNYALHISPNPVSDFLNITVNKDKAIAQIEVIDASGKQLFFKNNIQNSEYRINTQAFPSGIYYLNISFSDSIRITKAFVKK